MTKFKCKCGEVKDLSSWKIIHNGTDWVVGDAECKCGLYMDQVFTKEHEGIPELIRTENSLSKKGDKMWKQAKEKLVGNRGINENIN
tara:strand:- start:1483 stop:1743 length:261 start_codon:yes stop_codon:yes gene_type:complete